MVLTFSADTPFKGTEVLPVLWCQARRIAINMTLLEEREAVQRETLMEKQELVPERGGEGSMPGRSRGRLTTQM